VKIAVVIGGIDELKGKNDIYGRGTGSNAKAAISRAMAVALKSTSRRKSFHGIMTFRGTITVTEGAPAVVEKV
jgi:ribosomal protein S5